MRSIAAKSIARLILAGSALLATLSLASFAQQPQAMCHASLETYVIDRSLKATRIDQHSVSMVRGGVVYICRCDPYNDARPPKCDPRDSSGSGGSSDIDLSRFSPGQQLALKATQSLIDGLFKSIFRPSSKNNADSAAAALQARQEAIRKQEEERLQALDVWEKFQVDERARAQREQEEAREKGQEMLAQMGGAGGQGLAFQPISGGKLDMKPLPAGKYPAPDSPLKQASCAAYFSEEARKLADQGKLEQAEFMSLQAQKAMVGEPLDAPCRAAAVTPAAPVADSPTVQEVIGQYKVKIQELLDLSRKLAEVRQQKVIAETEVKNAEDEITKAKARKESATKPEEKKAEDDLLAELSKLKGEAEDRVKIADANEKAFLLKADETKTEVDTLGSKLQVSKDKK
jgi:hypothetical protein